MSLTISVSGPPTSEPARIENPPSPSATAQPPSPTPANPNEAVGAPAAPPSAEGQGSPSEQPSAPSEVTPKPSDEIPTPVEGLPQTLTLEPVPVTKAPPPTVQPGSGGAATTPAQAPKPPDEKTSNLEALDLVALMDLKVSLSTKIEQTQEEAPAIMSVISRHDIEAYGARDLSDVLRLVPGMEFGSDAFGLAGLGQRGLWAHEGKVLVMLNGMALNDGAYGAVNYFATYPATMIERVEIIRGPGSAVHGGFAEIGVINIVTRPGAALNGVRLEGSGGVAGRDAIGSVSAAAGVKAGDFSGAVHLGRNYSVLTSEKYKDFYGGSVAGGRTNFPRDFTSIVVEINYKEAFKLNAIHASTDFGGQDTFGAAAPKMEFIPRQNNKRTGVTASYEFKIKERLRIEPKAEYYQGNMITTPATPRMIGDNPFATPFIDLTRYRLEVMAKYQFTSKINALLGAGYFRDTVRHIGVDGQPGIALPNGIFRYSTHAMSRYVYGQYMHSISIVGLTLGARYENTTFGDAFSPRAGVVLNKGRFTTKLLYGRAFRIPTPFQSYSRLQEIGYLKPELSDTTELQLGLRISPRMRAKVNGFFTRVQDPIQWISSTNSYQNYGKADSLGVEGEFEVRFEKFGGFANASYARPSATTSKEFTTVSGNYFLGMPPFKFCAGAYYRYRSVEVAPAVEVLSKRYGQSQASSLSEDGRLGTTKYPALALANLTVNWRDVLGFKNTRLMFSAHNIFGAPYVLLQPYYGGHAPLHAQDRTFRVHLEIAL